MCLGNSDIDSGKYFFDYQFLSYLPHNEHILDSLERTIELENTELKVMELADLSKYYFFYNIDKSIGFARRAYNISQSLSYEKGIEESLLDLGYYFHFIGNADSATFYIEKYMDYALAVGDKYLIAKAKMFNAINYMLTLDFLKGFEFYLDALNFYTEQNDNYGIALTHYYLGRSYMQIDDYITSLFHFDLASQLFESMNRKAELSLVYKWNALALIKENHHKLAARNLHKSLALNKEINNISSTVFLYLDLSRFHMDYGRRYDSSFYYLNKALDLCQTYKFNYQSGLSYSVLAYYYLIKDDLKKALDYNIKALEVRSDHGMKYLTGSSMINIGEIYMKQKDYNNAKEYFIMAMNLASELHSLFYLAKAYYNLYKLYGLLNDQESELKYYALYADMNNRLINQKNNKELIKLKYQFEKDENAKEREILEREHNIKNLKLSEEKLIGTFLIISVFLMITVAIVLYSMNANKKRIGKQLQTANDKLAASEKALINLNNSKDRFFSITAHDLKNPLQYFRMAFEMMSNNFEFYTKEDRNRLLKEMRASTDNLYYLLENLLLWSKIMTKSLDINYETFELRSALSGIVRDQFLYAKKKGLQIKTDIDSGLYINGDQSLIKIILKNVINNAIKFTSEGEIQINASIKEDFIEMNIIDNGIGMSYIEMENLFKIDYRSNKLGTQKEKGTGLGMIVSKKLIELNGGSIWVESKDGLGSTFTILLLSAN